MRCVLANSEKSTGVGRTRDERKRSSEAAIRRVVALGRCKFAEVIDRHDHPEKSAATELSERPSDWQDRNTVSLYGERGGFDSEAPQTCLSRWLHACGNRDPAYPAWVPPLTSLLAISLFLRDRTRAFFPLLPGKSLVNRQKVAGARTHRRKPIATHARSCDPAPPARENERFLCTDTPAAQGCPARALHGNRWVDSPMHFYAPCLCTLNRRPLLRRRDHQSLRKDRAQSGALRTGLPLRRERNIASAHARQQRSAPRWSACHQTGI